MGPRMLAHVLAIAAVAAIGLPFFWMLATSLKTPVDLAQYPPIWWPDVPRWENYADAWRSAPFATFYWNSLVTSAIAAVLQLLTALLMAYAFAFIAFPGKSVLFMAILATMMVPDEMKLVPNYILLSRLGWIDTWQALIVPPIAHAFPILVLYQRFRALPRALIEAAAMDGASHPRILFGIVAPLSRPAIAATLLIAFLGRWNDYLWPLVATNSESMRTLPVGLAYLRAGQEGAIQWPVLMAGSVFVMIPVLVLFGLMQRQFVDGMTQGAIKG